MVAVSKEYDRSIIWEDGRILVTPHLKRACELPLLSITRKLNHKRGGGDLALTPHLEASVVLPIGLYSIS